MAAAAAPPPLPFTPKSLKRQHWVLLGREAALKRPGIWRHEVYGRGLVTFQDTAGELHVMDEACPHRGASLACGAVRDRSIVCPYHGMAFGAHSSPDRAYDYAILQGLVWVDYAKDLLAQHTMPPYVPEFSSPEFRVTGYSATMDANAVVALECLLDWTHPALGPARPPVVTALSPDAARARRTYDTSHGPLVVETESRLPFTAVLRFSLDGVLLLVVLVSLLPTGPARCAAHVHTARSIRPGPGADWLFQLVNGAPDVGALGDAAAAVDPAAWSRNRLVGPGDELLATYREAMRNLHPDVLAYFVS